MRTVVPTTLLALAIGAAATPTASAGEIFVDQYADFVTFTMADSPHDMRVHVVGPEGFSLKQNFRGDETAYLETVDAEGKPLADGLYRYEVRVMPSEALTRADVEALKGDFSTVTGSFRVVGGLVVDPNKVEE